MRFKKLWFLAFAFSLLTGKQPISGQQTILGPVLAGRVVGGAWITFEDVGSNRTWRVTLPNSSFVPTSWSSDGCDLLLQGSGRWAILSIPDATIRETPLSQISGSRQSFGAMIWSFDGKSLTSSVYLSDTDVRIYSVNLETFATNLILSLNQPSSAVQWLSDTELLYRIAGGDYFIWDTVAQKSSLYRSKPQLPPTWLSDVYFSEESQVENERQEFYSVDDFRSFISASQEVPPPEDINTEYVATLEAIPQVPGFDIYTFRDHSSKHIDVVGQLLQFLVWSPSSERIVVTTDPSTTPDDKNGIYSYNLQDDLLEKLGEFPAMYDSEYGGYAPTWSPDSNWLAFNTPRGYVMYNLETKETHKLSEQFDGMYMSLQWSPVMDYSSTECS